MHNDLQISMLDPAYFVLVLFSKAVLLRAAASGALQAQPGACVCKIGPLDALLDIGKIMCFLYKVAGYKWEVTGGIWQVTVGRWQVAQLSVSL